MGNVGSHLAEWLSESYNVTSINSRSFEGIGEYYDIIIISTKDEMIPEISEKIKGKGIIVAHTSGSVSIEALSGCAQHFGVFYPLQTFTKEVAMNKADTPVFIEGSDPLAYSTLYEIASSFTNKIFDADSEKRKKLHIAAVFACNFSNALIGIADNILKKEGYDYSVLLPLISQTIDKLKSTNPKKAQTGPASRGDGKIIESHLKYLSKDSELSNIYQVLSDYIMNHRHDVSKED